jgi:hypothetical protein
MQQDITRRDIAITVAVIAILLGSVIGWFAYKHHKTTPHKVALSGVYAGWATDNTSLPGLQFYYPPAWTDVDSHSICTGALLISVTPPTNEITAAQTGPQYYIEIEKYGTQNASCKPDGTDLSGASFSSVSSSDQLQKGIFKKDWLTFFTGGDMAYSTTKADSAVVTPTEYNGSQTAFTNAGTVSYKGSTYQLSIVTSTTETQTETPANISIASFKGTQLYKDTLNILNSIQAN